MDRRDYKKKPQHLVTDGRTGEIKRIVHPSDTDIGSSQINADLRVFGVSTINGVSNVIGTLDVTGVAKFPNLAVSVNSCIFGHRLSLSQSVAVPTADIPSGSTLWLTSHTSNFFSLYDGATWQVKSTGSVAFTLTGLTANKNYDVFVFENTASLALNLELVAWTSNTARATTLGTQDGILVKSDDLKRRYAGTVRTVSTTAVADRQSQRFVWNQYNRVEKSLKVTESANNWTYNTVAFRPSNNNIYNSFEYVAGDSTLLSVRAQSIGGCSGGAAYAGTGIGIDSTTVNSADIFGQNVDTLNGVISSEYRGRPSAGYHRITWLECGGGVANMVWYGDATQPTLYQMGMLGYIII